MTIIITLILSSLEGSVYTWGSNDFGALGLGQCDSTWKHFPSKIDSLRRYNIVSSCAGDGFSIFLSNYGVVLSCGDNTNGCLGHPNAKSVLTPKAIGKGCETSLNLKS